MDILNLAALTPSWMDAFLIAPFRWCESPLWAIWSGSAFLSVYCVVLGDCTGALLFWSHRGYYTRLQGEMVKAHNLSVEALHSGNKSAYTAANKIAHEYFGKAFFAQAAVGMASLWPLPFALAWMALRFEGLPVYRLPIVDKSLGYVFVMLVTYIPARILFARLRKRLPGFRQVEEFRKKAAEVRGEMRSFLVEPLG